MKFDPKYLCYLSLIFVFLSSCKDDSEEIEITTPEPITPEITSPENDLTILPADTGGDHIPIPLKPEENVYGHYIYIPAGYSDTSPSYPLIVFLHGMGRIGNSENDKTELEKVTSYGPPFLIENGQWNPKHPAVVVSPQCHDEWWDAEKIHQYISYIINKYNINENRIYISGVSMGGYGVFSYLETFGDDSYATAAIPICGGGNPDNADAIRNIPVWAFHGENDEKVLPGKSIEMIAAINEQDPVHKAKLTIYPEVGHDSWSMTYDGSGMGKESDQYDVFDEDIYSWFFSYTKSDSGGVTLDTF